MTYAIDGKAVVSNKCEHLEWKEMPANYSEVILGLPLGKELPDAQQCQACGMIRFKDNSKSTEVSNGYYVVTSIGDAK